jgi:lipopolysaccharide/colanic/teichoic acid biosynthesis glycosyltransferase
VPDWLQRLVALVLALATTPLLGALAAAVRLDSPGSAFYIARRVGEGGRIFGLLKLRTMRQGSDRGPGISLADDPRVTRIGRILRGVRLDELPQLWNVARGEMRLVGPRPEDPRFVDLEDPLHRIVFRSRPGISGATQLLQLDEPASLGGADPETSYRTRILPAKVAIDAAYLDRRSFSVDCWILGHTVLALLGRPPSEVDVAARLGISRYDRANGDDGGDGCGLERA